jgi:hypothetical protein
MPEPRAAGTGRDDVEREIDPETALETLSWVDPGSSTREQADERAASQRAKAIDRDIRGDRYEVGFISGVTVT